ncbi:MAG: YeeE/YedE thiosulfate transporter family protein [Anaerolineae bacterium]
MKHKTALLVQGLVFGIVFGFLLQKGGVTKYDVIVGQLLLEDFTVLKIILTALVVGGLGLHLFQALGWVSLSPKAGSWGKNAIGGLIFGVGFALLGYCPGTIAGAIGNGYLDATLGGLAGILIGSALLAAWYPVLKRGILKQGDFGTLTLPQLLRVNVWVVMVPLSLVIVLVLYLLERAGL